METPVDKSATNTAPDAADQSRNCYHCGLPCPEGAPEADGKLFCCVGCRAVYQLLGQNKLHGYYAREDTPGTRPTLRDHDRFAYLDDPAITEALLEYADNERAKVTLLVPAIHCVSCVWLLENLHRLHEGILRATVNITTRRVAIVYDPRLTTLRAIVERLAQIGYEPDIRLDALSTEQKPPSNRRLYAQVGVAGFAFANVMLFSFPEYLSSGGLGEGGISTTLRIASLVLSIPVLLFSARDYFVSAWMGLKQRRISLDVPLALGISTLFLRSTYEILLAHGHGYFDSFTGLVFFLLIGRVFQQKTYERLSFDRDYRSYFPISCLRRSGTCDTPVPITNIHVGDRIVVRNQELVPADAILISGKGFIDYSYVTGESEPKPVVAGERVYAGGRQAGEALELEVIREVAQSDLVSLWNTSLDSPVVSRRFDSVADAIGKHFTLAVLTIAVATAIYWYMTDPGRMAITVTAVLIVACPCALALSRPFVMGTALRVWGKHRLFMRGTDVIDALGNIDEIVFDKTGTLTHSERSDAVYEGEPLNSDERDWLAALARHSTHPISRQLAASLSYQTKFVIDNFMEQPGAGIGGHVQGHEIRLGSRSWAAFDKDENRTGTDFVNSENQTVFVGIDGHLRGRYLLATRMRENLKETISQLQERYQLSVLTGDSSRDAETLTGLFGPDVHIAFQQSPRDKFDFVTSRQRDGHRVLMVGDGLNDSGALRSATVGIAVTEDTSSFSPASDGIIEASQLQKLPRFLQMAARCGALVYLSFALSFLYNIIGLSFATTGHLSPLVSAILMPASSISVVIFATVATRFLARREGLA